jgi:hypothetical protein
MELPCHKLQACAIEKVALDGVKKKIKSEQHAFLTGNVFAKELFQSA